MIFKTQTGSTYILDRGTMGWSRQSTSKSGQIRQEFGTLLDWPTIVVGKYAALHDSKVLPGHCDHYVFTSQVTEILED